jgi:hypothetical protein
VNDQLVRKTISLVFLRHHTSQHAGQDTRAEKKAIERHDSCRWEPVSWRSKSYLIDDYPVWSGRDSIVLQSRIGQGDLALRPEGGGIKSRPSISRPPPTSIDRNIRGRGRDDEALSRLVSETIFRFRVILYALIRRSRLYFASIDESCAFPRPLH